MNKEKIYTCVVVDDDPNAIAVLKDYIAELPYLEMVGSFANPIEALSAFKSLGQVDIAFLDVEMPKMSGLEAVKSFREYVKYLIFQSGHRHYAADGFDLEVDQFLTKPFSLAQFAQKVELVLEDSEAGQVGQYPRLLYIKGDGKNMFKQLDTELVRYFQAHGNYTKIFMGKESEITYANLSDMEQQLDPVKFMRVHKSYIVAVNRIKKVEGHVLKLDDKSEIPLGETYQPGFFKRLQGLLVRKKKP